jgi:hypothetical protein
MCSDIDDSNVKFFVFCTIDHISWVHCKKLTSKLICLIKCYVISMHIKSKEKNHDLSNSVRKDELIFLLNLKHIYMDLNILPLISSNASVW